MYIACYILRQWVARKQVDRFVIFSLLVATLARPVRLVFRRSEPARKCLRHAQFAARSCLSALPAILIISASGGSGSEAA